MYFFLRLWRQVSQQVGSERRGKASGKVVVGDSLSKIEGGKIESAFGQ